MKASEMVKNMGSFSSMNQVVRYLTNMGCTVVYFDGFMIETLNGSVELIEKNGRIWAK